MQKAKKTMSVMATRKGHWNQELDIQLRDLTIDNETVGDIVHLLKSNCHEYNQTVP